MPQKRMECFRLLFDHLSVFEWHKRFTESRESVRDDERCGRSKEVNAPELIDQRVRVRVTKLSFYGSSGEIPSEEASTLQIGSVAFPPGKCASPQLHPCHRLFGQDGYEDSSPPHSPDLDPCDFWSFPKLGGSRYETIEEMKEDVTKVIDMLTQEDFHWGFQRLLDRYNKNIAAGGHYFAGDKSFMCVLSIKVPIRKKSGNLFNDPHTLSYFCLCTNEF